MCSPKTLDLETDVGSIAALEFSGAADGPLVVAIQGKSANIDVITEWEPAGMLLGAAGYRVVLPNLHSNERTKPGTVASADVHAVVRAIYHRYNAASAIIMGKSWGGGEAVSFAAAHRAMVNALVLVAPSLTDFSLLSGVADVPCALFWARDDTVKSFELSDRFAGAMSNLTLHAVQHGGHRVLDEYLPAIQAHLASVTPPGTLRSTAAGSIAVCAAPDADGATSGSSDAQAPPGALADL